MLTKLQKRMKWIRLFVKLWYMKTVQFSFYGFHKRDLIVEVGRKIPRQITPIRAKQKCSFLKRGLTSITIHLCSAGHLLFCQSLHKA